MKSFTAFCILVSVYISGSCQKNPIDSAMLAHWPRLINYAISNDGQYLYYLSGSDIDGITMTLRDTADSWHMLVRGSAEGSFSADGRQFIFRTPDSRLKVLFLGTDSSRDLGEIESFQSIDHAGSLPVLVYISKADRRLHVLDATGKSVLTVDSVKRWQLVNDHLLVDRSLMGGSALLLTDLRTAVSTEIWKDTAEVADFRFDRSGQQVVFQTSTRRAGSPAFSIWYYDSKSGRLPVEIRTLVSNFPDSMVIARRSDVPCFNDDGNCILFAGQPDEVHLHHLLSGYATNWTLWNTSDPKLESHEQAIARLTNKTYLCAMSLKRLQVDRIEKDADQQVINWDADHIGNYVLVKTQGGNEWDWNWNPASRVSVYSYSFASGVSKLLLRNRSKFFDEEFRLSPDNRFLVYFNNEQNGYYSIELATQTSRLLSKGAGISFADTIYNWPGLPRSVGFAAWDTIRQTVWVNDEYDIWGLDLYGSTRPVNLTNGYGRRNKIVFRLVQPNGGFEATIPVIDIGSKKLLSAFSVATKESGFFFPGKRPGDNPEKRIMGKYLYQFPFMSENGLMTRPPLKARNSDVYLLTRTSDVEAPNLFLATDYGGLTRISDIRRPDSCLWHTAELIRFSLPNGKTAEGILFKPENFNPHKKYPVIFSLYEGRSSERYNFINPELSGGDLPIAWFLSRGYCVVDPDIAYQPGREGANALEAVRGAVGWLGQYPCFDLSRLGVCGVSFGANEINYIVSHSNLFAAAAESAGSSDELSNYFTVNLDNRQFIYKFETGQYRFGQTPWQNLHPYLENSAVVFADKVKTPILIMHNQDDRAVAYEQGLQWFSALRRLGRHAWLLSYDQEGHGLVYGDNRLDYTRKLEQFFGYYLKGGERPGWLDY